MPPCQFLINFPLLKVKICFEKAQNIIRPFQNLLESLFSVHFKNTSPARSLKAISQCMPPQYRQSSTARYPQLVLIGPTISSQESVKGRADVILQTLLFQTEADPRRWQQLFRLRLGLL